MPTSIASRAAKLMQAVQSGPIRTRWHWLDYNFNPRTRGFVTVAGPTVMALAAGDAVMPGFAAEQLKRLESFGGVEKSRGHYQQILAWYCEVLVVAHLAAYAWPAPVAFEMEPTAGDAKANPEVVIKLDGVGALGVEVKAADLSTHLKHRASNPWQLNARTTVSPQSLGKAVTLPRDNPVKDFLVSADNKFAAFRALDPDFRSVLVIVWDDFVNEPLTALTSPASGLFTANSFHRVDGRAVEYPNVDAVLLVRHQHQVVEGLAGQPLIDERAHLLDYGQPGSFPPHALVTNPAGRPLPAEFLAALHAVPLQALNAAAEYNPGEIVMWAGTADDPTD
ncbi:hypothetical protein [Streptomyces collinus]|uniref:Uncharacterized protein n=1 Tax=Streptomyces collinus TaxID=42684 RepID=A0AA89U2L1_STRCU|nr:hypothetical protein [Streptomyces collinus]MBB5816883.1 hypothetical protein [Streptomyces collinus]WMX61882.1 hypothetical protein RFN52_00265 [Streptomyces collinus]